MSEKSPRFEYCVQDGDSQRQWPAPPMCPRHDRPAADLELEVDASNVDDPCSLADERFQRKGVPVMEEEMERKMTQRW